MDAVYFLQGYEKALKQIDHLKRKKEMLKSMAEKITVDPSVDHVQSFGKQDITGNVAASIAMVDSDIQDASIVAEEECATIMNVLAKLNRIEEAQILLMRHIDLLKHKEIQERLAMSERTEYRKYNRGIEDVQHLINNGS